MSGVILVLVVFGIVALLLGFSRWLAHRHWAAAGNVAAGLTLFVIAHAYWPAIENLRTYDRLPMRQTMIAQLHCERTAPGVFRLTLTRLPGGHMQVYELTGDEWQVEARTLVWKDVAQSIGAQPRYRLERLSARSLRAGQGAGTASGSGSESGPDDGAHVPDSFDLADDDAPGEDVWSQARAGERWVNQVDAGRVYGPWHSLTDGALFDVWLGYAPGKTGATLSVTDANQAGDRTKGE